MQSSFTLAESFAWKDFLQPVHYCWSGRTQRQPGSSKDLDSRLQWLCGRSEGQRPRPRHAYMLFLSPVSDSHLLPTSAKTPGCFGKSCTLLAWLSAARVWEMRSCGKKAPVEPRGMWNLGSSQIQITFTWPSAPVFVGVGISDSVELTQQLYTQRLARFLPSPLICSVSLPTPYRSHPGASNLYREIRRTHPRN